MGAEVHGLDETINDLDGAQERIADLTPATQAIASAIKRFVEARFSTRTGPDGQAWAPTKGPSKDRGVMRRSVYAEGHASGVRFGASAAWADEHQYGTDRMPARPFLPTGEFTSGPAAQLRDEIAKIIRRHVALLESSESDSDEISFDF